MKALIIDDVQSARQMLRALIENFVSDLEICGEAADLATGIIEINQQKPDIVFCDIEMPGLNGLQITEFFSTDLTFQLVFVTAYSEFMLQALRIQATDYLLKPVDPDQLIAAVNRAKQRIESKELMSAEKKLFIPPKLAIPVLEGMIFIATNDIIYLKAEAAYTQLVMRDGSTLLASKNIGEFDEMLKGDKRFFRTHRSFLINLDLIKKYVRQGGASVVMENDHEVGISRERKDEFLEIVAKLYGSV